MRPCPALRRRTHFFVLAAFALAGPAWASHPSNPVLLAQQNGDATGIDGGVTAEGREILLTATSDATTCNYSPYHLEFEVRPISQGFSNVPTHYSASITKASCAQQQFPWTRITGLTEGVAYKWQVHEVNMFGYTSGWVLYNSGGTAFTTGALPANHLQFTSAASLPTAGTCAGPSTVQLQNAGGAPVTVGTTTSVPVFQSSDVLPAVGFYSDATCDAGISATSMAAGTSTAGFYWRSTRSGAISLGADIKGGLWALQGQTVNPGPAVALVFIDPNYTGYLGTCQNARTVQLQDSYGNPAPSGAGTAVALTSSSPTVAFYSDASCTLPISSVTITAGSNQASFYFKENTVGAKYVYATATGLPQASQYSYTYGYTNVITPAQTRDAGQCSTLTTVQTQNGLSQPYVAPSGTVMYFYGSPGMSFYSEGSCDAGLSNVTMDGGTSNVSFFWRSTMATYPYNPIGYSTYVYGSASWYSASVQYETINPGPPYSLAFGNSPQTIVAGTCSPVATARSMDLYGNYAPAAGNITVGLATTSSAGKFYSDPLCTAQISSTTIATGGLLSNFYWKDTTPGSPTLTLSSSAPSLVVATQTETVIPKLVFTSPGQNIVAGTCSAATTVQSQDGLGLPWNASTSTTINLSTTSPSGPFFSDPACSVPISTVTLAAGASAVTFYWKDTKAGSPTLTASATGYAQGTQAETIRPDVPAAMAFTTAAQAVGAGLCSAVTTVEQEDQYGNAATQATARTVSLLTTSATGRFYSNSTCTAQISTLTIAAGTSPASFYWSDTAAPQTPTLTARSAGLLDGTQVETVSVGAATGLAITSAPKSVTAGACSGAATVGSMDAAGNASNVSTATTVALSSTTGTTVFYAGGGCAGAPVTSVLMSAGTSSATFSWLETSAGSLTITPAATGFTGSGQSQTVTPAAGTQLSFTSAAQSITAGNCSGATAVAVTDAFGNPSAGGAARTVTLSSTSGTLGFYADAACGTAVTSITISAGATSATFYFRDLFTGTPTLTAASAGLISGTQTESIGGRDQLTFRWYSSAGAALGAQDAAIQAAPGAQLHLRLGIKSIAFSWKLSTGDQVPSGETFANSETHTGSYLNVGVADGSSETLTETRVGKGNNRYYTLGDTTAAGWPFHIYAFPTVPSGKATYPLCLTAATTGEALQVGYSFTSTPTFSPTFPAGWQITSTSLTQTCFDLKPQGFNGGALTVYLRDALRGAGTDSLADTFTIDAVKVKGDPPTYLALERSPSSTFTSPTQVLSAELWDDLSYANGAVLAPALTGTTNSEVRVESRPSVPTNQVDVDPGEQGEWDFAIAFPAGGGSQYYRMVITDSLGTRVQALESTTAPAQADTAATKLVYTTSAVSVQAGTCAGPFTVQAQDPAGNARAQPAARTVTLTTTSGTFFASAACAASVTSVTMPAGSSNATFYWRGTVVGNPVLTAASAGLTSASQTETVTPAPPVSVAFTTASQNVTVGACSAAATVQSRDTYGNASPVAAAATGPITSTSGTTTFYLGTGCPGAAVTSLTIPAGQSSVTFSFKDTVAGSPTITYSPAGLGSASQTETFSVGVPTQLAVTTAAATLTAGQCSSAVTGAAGTVVQAQDSFGNPANVTANITVGLASGSATLAFFSDSGCTVAIASSTIVQPANTTRIWFRDTTAGTSTVTGTAAGLGPANQTETINPAAPSALAFTSAAQTVTAGACSSPVTLRTQDVYGNVSPEPSSTLLPLSSSDSPRMTFFSDLGCTTPISSATVGAGTSTAQLWFKDTLAGTPSLNVSGPSLGNASQVETIKPAPTAALTMAGFPSPSTAGAAGTLTLAAVDPYGNVAQDYAGSVQFSSSDPAAALPPVSSFSPGTGTRSFSATLYTAGTQSLTAVDNGAPPLTATQPGITVVAASATTLQVSGVPSPVTSGSAHDVTVSAADAYGNRATGYSGTVRFTSTDTSATLPSSYGFVAADQGRRTFTGGVVLRTPGTHTLTATDTVTGAISGQQSGIVVLQAQGGACGGDGECATGYCVGSVCCDTSCAGACNSCVLAGRVGTCSVVANGTPCPNSLYCDGMETCQAGLCSQGAPVSCVDPKGYDQLACDEPTQSCVLVPNAAPFIAHDASPRGAPNVPYRYNASGRVTALGARPMQFGACAPLSGFLVDKLTGVVSWSPPAPGTYTACVNAQNSSGQDQYTFPVTVSAPSGSAPMADFTVTPDTAEAPLSAAFDGSLSSGDPSALPLLWSWDFGDLSVLGGGQQVTDDYLLAGGYQAELTAFDAAGRPGTVKKPLWVLDRGRRPPSAKILASALTGDGSLSSSFSCDCKLGDAPLRGFFWELGDVATATASTVTQSFTPGRYRVRLTVLDGNGLTATDSVEVNVRRGGLEPPECRMALSPPAGPAPLTVTHHATFGDSDGSVVSKTLTFSDGSTGVLADLTRTYDQPGRYRTVLKVTDDSGLTCVDVVQVAAIGAAGKPPPGFLSSPALSGSCGTAYQYSDQGRPLVSGTGTIQFSLVPVAGGAVPDGMKVDATSGAILWTPSSKNAGLNQVVLRATSADGVADQPLDITIACADQQNLSLGCTCSEAGGASWIAVGLGLVLLARLRRARAYSPTLARRRRLPR